MKTQMKTLLFAGLLAAGAAQATEYKIDPNHSSVQFAVKHMMIATVRGHFPKVEGTVTVDEKDLTKSKVNVTIDAASVDTRQPNRDADLKGANFFDVEKHPKITFRSTQVKKGQGGQFEVVGDLTIRGITKPATLKVESLSPPMKNPWGQVVRGASATATLDRRDWGLTWNKALEAGGVLIGDEVKLQLDVEMVEQKPEEKAANTRG